MPTPIGARVGAILSATETEVRLLGYGVYDGDHEPPFGPFGLPLDEHQKQIAEMKADGRLRAVAQLLRHRQLSTTERYTHGMDTGRRAAAAATVTALRPAAAARKT